MYFSLYVIYVMRHSYRRCMSAVGEVTDYPWSGHGSQGQVRTHQNGIARRQSHIENRHLL